MEHKIPKAGRPEAEDKKIPYTFMVHTSVKVKAIKKEGKGNLDAKLSKVVLKQSK